MLGLRRTNRELAKKTTRKVKHLSNQDSKVLQWDLDQEGLLEIKIKMIMEISITFQSISTLKHIERGICAILFLKMLQKLIFADIDW